MKQNRVQRSNSDLQNELLEQLELLEMHCEAYDAGKEAVAKHIAVVLRVLLHHHGSSRSLLEQLGLRSGYFKDSAVPFDRKSLVAIHTLVAINCFEARWWYAPTGLEAKKSILFADWWNAPVVRDCKNREFTRREIVTHVADTDGGAHVDPGLEEPYMDLSRNNSLGWKFGSGNNPALPVEGRPELACIRQIAAEVLTTLRSKAPTLFSGNA